jgi:hypothetical protein
MVSDEDEFQRLCGFTSCQATVDVKKKTVNFL